MDMFIGILLTCCGHFFLDIFNDISIDVLIDILTGKEEGGEEEWTFS